MSGNYTTATTDEVVVATASCTITLKTTGLPTGHVYTVTNSSSGSVTVQPASGLIEGEADAVLYEKDSLDLLFDGTNFIVK